ncbi:prephenate dehydratase [Corynebacterium aquatimens]|uniref:Prephenate dehydratase n=1 Tax=Corynebacterium aquatimens TaxID=1190508 RepID=A0A931DZ85_9CORY|nr:prephenate dehydratase [Corynebacterium aquatimens]MBG6122825.1 prephenate dehydratase [Corynebacterium aquatimens]
MSEPTKTVAFLGPRGTFTEEALWAFAPYIDGEIKPQSVDSPFEALDAVHTGKADYAVVAIENSVDGSVTTTADALIEAPSAQIYREVELPITFAIMVRPGTDLKELADLRAPRLSTHPVAYSQVKQWMRANVPGAAFQPASSNAAAAQAVADGDADVAAAPLRAADMFGLDVVARDVADIAGARTRFVLVGPSGRPTPRTGEDRTSVIFQLPNEPGTLVGALQEFAYRGVDLSRIESRPTRVEANTYNFYVDLVGHIDDVPVAEALRSLWLRSTEISFLGSWPRFGSERATREDAFTSEHIEQATKWVTAAREGHQC